MSLTFAPNNNSAAKFLFTGRTNDLEDIFNLILAGNCVALYGERRGGKTLTLEIVHDIINGSIEQYEGRLIDQTLVQALPIWRERLRGYRALLISLQATRNESELLNKFLYHAQRAGIYQPSSLLTTDGVPTTPAPQTLEELLTIFQNKCIADNQMLVILLDEMEVLGEYAKEDGGTVVELFSNRVSYTHIIYVHAGSYQWLDRVYSPGSQFTHLEPKYLKSINEQDMLNYLLSPISDDTQKTLVANLTGGKPLYTQYLGKAAYEGPHQLTEEALLNDSNYTSLREQIERNIYRERGLDEISKKLLAALAHHPNVTKTWLARKLKINKTEVSNKLEKLAEFGTVAKSGSEHLRIIRIFRSVVDKVYQYIRVERVYKSDSRYRIVGDFIERYGKEICDDPTRKGYGGAPTSWRQNLIPIARFAAMATFIVLAVLLYKYANPQPETRSFNFSEGVVRLVLPGSLETDESGKITAFVQNKSQAPIGPLKLVFDSEDIQFEQKGSNSITFDNIEPSITAKGDIDCQVLSSDKETLNSKMSIPSYQSSASFDINCRVLPLKKYSFLISSIITIIGLAIPWGSWSIVAGLIKKLISNSEDKG